MYTLNCKGRLLVIEKPLVMGIINCTPDSFYTGSRQQQMDLIVQKAGEMIQAGAGILDLGGQSTRPGSQRISAAEESARVLPAIEEIRKQFPAVFMSVDTYHSAVAAAAVNAGADMINDISAGEMDPEMIPTVAGLGVPYLLMHMKGSPDTMQTQTSYTDLIKELVDYFITKIEVCKAAGIRDLVIDPGFGFSKTIEQNFHLLKYLDAFQLFRLPLLVGLSRKSTIYKTLQITADEALNGTTVLNTLALSKGANILRVHDVKEAVETVQLFEAYQNS